MPFPPLLAPDEVSCHLGGARAGLDFPASTGQVDHAVYLGSSRGHAKASPDSGAGQGTGSVCVPDCFGSWCCLVECDCGCHDPESVFQEKPPSAYVNGETATGFNSRKHENGHRERERDESISGSSLPPPETGSVQDSSDGIDREAVSEHLRARKSSRDADGSESASGPEKEWPDCEFRGERVVRTYTPQGDPVTVPLTCESLGIRQWCSPCVAHRHMMLVARYTAQAGHDAPRTSVVATLSENDDIVKYVECFAGVARRTDGRDVSYSRPLYKTSRGSYRVMIVFDRLLSDRAHELMHRKLRRWPTVQVRQKVITGDDFAGFLRRQRREGGSNTVSWSQNWAKMPEVPLRYLTAGGSISVPEYPVRQVQGPGYYHEWRRVGEPGSLEACQLWVRDHVQELPTKSTLVQWGSGPRYRAKEAVRRWVAETKYTGNHGYLLHAAEAYTGLRAMRECYRPLLEGWKPEPGWFDAPSGEDPVDDWLWDDDFEVVEPGGWDLG